MVKDISASFEYMYTKDAWQTCMDLLCICQSMGRQGAAFCKDRQSMDHLSY